MQSSSQGNVPKVVTRAAVLNYHSFWWAHTFCFRLLLRSNGKRVHWNKQRHWNIWRHGYDSDREEGEQIVWEVVFVTMLNWLSKRLTLQNLIFYLAIVDLAEINSYLGPWSNVTTEKWWQQKGRLSANCKKYCKKRLGIWPKLLLWNIVIWLNSTFSV